LQLRGTQREREREREKASRTRAGVYTSCGKRNIVT